MHAANRVTTPSGARVLVVGGANQVPWAATSTIHSDTVLFDPSGSGTWSTVATSQPLGIVEHSAVTLANGTVAIGGGYDYITSGTIHYKTSGSLFNGANISTTPFSTSSNSMPTPAWGATAVLLQNGLAGFVGGSGASGPVAALQAYDPTPGTNAWSSLGWPSGAAGKYFVAAAPFDATLSGASATGPHVLIAGGASSSGSTSTGLAVRLDNNGTTCSAAAQCKSGSCHDGVCCDTACNRGCEVCKFTMGASADGVCTPAGVPGWAGAPSCAPYTCNSSDPACPTTCSDDNQCTMGYFCGRTGSNPYLCIPRISAGGACDPPFDSSANTSGCATGLACDHGTCSTTCSQPCDVFYSGGNCPHTTLPLSIPACGNYLCNLTSACPTTCTTSAKCVAGTHCVASHCIAGLADGTACTANGDCNSDTCTGGVCAGSPCSGDGQCGGLAYCASTVCAPKHANGSTATVAAHCASGFISGGLCCNRACTGTCNSCSHNTGAAVDGTCDYLISGTCPAKGYGSTCTSNSDCQRDLECSAGGCSCAPGSNYCASKNRCLRSTECCATSDCSPGSAPDNCHLPMACVASQCVYPSICTIRGQSCSNGVCSCPASTTMCPQASLCIPSTMCCTNSDCIVAPDSCHSTTGATCFAGSCDYPGVQCAPGQICNNGSCAASLLNLAALVSSSTPGPFAYDASAQTGAVQDTTNVSRVQYQFTWSNTGSASISLLPDPISGVTVYSFKKNGIPVPKLYFMVSNSVELLAYMDQFPLQELTGGANVASSVTGTTANGFFKTKSNGMAERVVYWPDGPGHYTVVFQYSADRGFSGPIFSNEVSYDLY